MIKMDSMNILMAFNSSYYMPATVTIYSVLINNPYPVTFYVLYSDLKDYETKRLKEIVTESGHGQIVFISVNKNSFEGLPVLSWITKETYYRLLAQKLLPETVERFLWLDSDLLVLKDIMDFYRQDFEGNLLVATSVVKEGEIHEHYRQMSLPADLRYFNAGILLYDLKAQREKIDPDVYERYLKVFEKRLKFGDQDVLNAVFYKCVKYADFYVYNLTVNYYDKLSKEEKRNIIKNCCVIHYNGMSKPWNPDYHFLKAKIFWKYAEELEEYKGLYFKMKDEQKKSRKKYLRKKRKQQEKANKL